ncbi:MAG TPA: carbohydrate ABC transporter permease [Corynebacteriales bacterium]|nr:carbohydrate ABC transporter permease [Mycobacteriales bacterium]
MSDSTKTTQPPKNKRPKAGSIAIYVAAVLIMLWGLLPFYWMLVTAFRKKDFTFSTVPFPTHLTLDNFREALSTEFGNNFLRAIGNSLIISLTTTLIAVAVGVFAAYALSRYEFRGKYVVLGVIMGASMFPSIALVTPLFQLFTDIGLRGSYWALIIPNISFALPLTIYTLTSFVDELPWELEQAARVDGCTRGQAFRKVMLPLAAPAVFTTAILAFIMSWNEFLLAQQLSTVSTEPVTVAIARFTGGNAFEYPYATVMAAGALVTVPLVIMVLIFQRKIIAGLTSGGVKE